MEVVHFKSTYQLGTKNSRFKSGPTSFETDIFRVKDKFIADFSINSWAFGERLNSRVLLDPGKSIVVEQMDATLNGIPAFVEQACDLEKRNEKQPRATLITVFRVTPAE